MAMPRCYRLKQSARLLTTYLINARTGWFSPPRAQCTQLTTNVFEPNLCFRRRLHRIVVPRWRGETQRCGENAKSLDVARCEVGREGRPEPSGRPA